MRKVAPKCVAPDNQDFQVRLFAPKVIRCGLSGATLSHLKSHLKVLSGATFALSGAKKVAPDDMFCTSDSLSVGGSILACVQVHRS